jgi:hypothetical protein
LSIVKQHGLLFDSDCQVIDLVFGLKQNLISGERLSKQCYTVFANRKKTRQQFKKIPFSVPTLTERERKKFPAGVRPHREEKKQNNLNSRRCTSPLIYRERKKDTRGSAHERELDTPPSY